MYISKGNLIIYEVADKDKDIELLHNVHFAEDGTSIARNKKLQVAVSPVQEEVKKDLKNFITETGGNSATIPVESVKKVIKAIKPDKKCNGLLEHCDLEIENDIKFTTTDGIDNHIIDCKNSGRDYIDYKAIFQEFYKKKSGRKVILDANRLLILLQIIKKFNSGNLKELPVYLEFTDDNKIIIRTDNMITEQRLIALMTSYDFEENSWLDMNDWEKQLCLPEKPKKKKKKFKLKLKKRRK